MDMTQDDPAIFQKPADPTLDAGGISTHDLPEHRLPSSVQGREAKFQAIFRRSVLNEIHRHGSIRTDVEICGVLVGNVYHDHMGPFLLIESSIRGDAAEGHAAQVTFKAETWNHIQDAMDREHTDKKIVGWYHTHPGFGIFLSGMDLFIQDNFFNLPWQIAFVYDPIGGDEGSFVWRYGRSEREPFLIDETMSADEARKSEWEWKATPPADAALPESGVTRSLYGMEPKTAWIIAVVAFVISFVIAGLVMALL